MPGPDNCLLCPLVLGDIPGDPDDESFPLPVEKKGFFGDNDVIITLGIDNLLFRYPLDPGCKDQIVLRIKMVRYVAGIEIMIGLVILGILATIAIPAYQNFIEDGKTKLCEASAEAMRGPSTLFVGSLRAA